MEYWRKLQSAIPAYRMYRVRTEREIPIILLRRHALSWDAPPILAQDEVLAT